MQCSDSVANLAQAMISAQSELGNQTNTTKNEFLGNSYLPLPNLLDVVKPVLGKHKLSVIQIPTSDGHGVGITTMILHESGEWISDRVTVPVEHRKGNTLAQVAGGTVTYLRRYSLAAVLAIATEDDDGNHGKDPKTTESKGEYVDYSRMSPRDMTARQLGEAIKQESGNEEYIEAARQAYAEKDKARLATLLEEIRAKAAGATDKDGGLF